MYDIFNLPPRLFKYYRYDSTLNVRRLAGEVYLACPYDFNDPCDCQREINNNAKDKVDVKGLEWLHLKIKELGFNEQECRVQAEELLNGANNLTAINRKMLERMGILCLTDNQSDTLMWGYYANNDGLCIEYDKSKIVKNLLIGYVNNMNYFMTKLLFEDKKYYQIPSQRTPSIKPEIISKANMLITLRDVTRVHNRYLEDCNDDLKVLNFLRNIFLKRIFAQSIIYNVKPDDTSVPLFFLPDDKTSETKYFKKTKTWKHEKEFRFIISLGGRMPVNIGSDCIKNVYLGCNMTNERIAAIAYVMTRNGLKAGLYKMKRLKNCGLRPVKIDWEAHKGNLEVLDRALPQEYQ